jgi:hypothetical protein
MDPILVAQLRRQWVPVIGVIVFLLFLVAHLLWFQPAVKRYQAALKRAGDMGITLDPSHTPRMMPARVFALLSNNSLPEAVADAQGNSGELAASLLEEITQLASRHRMDVAEAEPGATSQLPRGVQVRARLRLTCSYQEFVDFLDDLNRSGRLISVDRFNLTSGPPGQHVLELWLTRYVLKQPAMTR